MRRRQYKMELEIHVENKKIKLKPTTFQKMLLLYNALEEGWSVEKKKEIYVFNKKHEGKKEILLDSYLETFMQSNMDINKVLSISNT